MKHLHATLVGLLVLAGLAAVARAVPIEGYAPSGAFRAVSVTEDGRLDVEIDTAVVQHVIVDTGTITAYLQTAPSLGHGCSSVSSGSTLLLATNATRKGTLLCNEDLTLNAWFGDATTTNANTPTTPPGSCVNPDAGGSLIYTGPLYAYTTAALRVCWYSK